MEYGHLEAGEWENLEDFGGASGDVAMNQLSPGVPHPWNCGASSSGWLR